MQAIIDQVRSLAKTSDEAGRYELQNALRDLQYQLDTPFDTFLRLYNSYLTLPMIYIAVQLKLFEILAESNSAAAHVTELAEKSGASPEVLSRVLRYLASVGFIDNVGPDAYCANAMTGALASPMTKPSITHALDTIGPALQAFPSFLAETKYQDMVKESRTSWNKGHNTDLALFPWLTQPHNAGLFSAFQQVMTIQQNSNWLTGLHSLNKEAANVQADQSQQPKEFFFVDVGGGKGHQCKLLLDKYPNLHGLIALQDLPQTTEELPPIPGVETNTHDFFKKQPIQGASFYYLRHVLHDWSDSDSVNILQNIASSMASKSSILVDEVTLPDVDAPWQATMADLTMGAIFGSKERTTKQFEELASKAGLKTVDVHKYNVASCDSVIVMQLA